MSVPASPPGDPQLAAELDAAVFRRLLEHLSARSDVQNIDLMELAGFCRNCLSRWYREAAAEHAVALTDAEARERVYGMPYPEWKARHQTTRAGEEADGSAAPTR